MDDIFILTLKEVVTLTVILVMLLDNPLAVQPLQTLFLSVLVNNHRAVELVDKMFFLYLNRLMTLLCKVEASSYLIRIRTDCLALELVR